MDSATQFSRQRCICLETYRKNGEAVRTPVWVVEDGGMLYVRTDPKTWKVRRIRKNPRVRLAPSDFRGKPSGQWIDGVAHFADAAEAERIIKLFRKKYGMTAAMTDFVNGIIGRHITTVITIKV